MNETLHLACAADIAYVPHTAATLHSVAANRGALDLDVHFLHGPELPRRTRWTLRRWVRGLGGRLRLHKIGGSRVAGLPTSEHVSAPMWFRIDLPELLSGVDRVLYLDGDTLAMDSLESLWETDLGDHLVAAVTNLFMRDEVTRSRPAAVGVPVEKYFNSGVLLMNLERMRRERTTDELRERGLAAGELLFPDQDVLNAVMAERRLWLHPRWNAMNSILTFDHAGEAFSDAEVAEARERPGIRHFEGPGRTKPWHRDCDFPHRELYFEHRRATPWPHVRLSS